MGSTDARELWGFAEMAEAGASVASKAAEDGWSLVVG
jgi:hypothetical protein